MKIEHIKLELLKPNPYRDLATYPWVEDKITALTKSFKDIGVFAGITARPMPDGTYEKWFGHHRHETARRLGYATLPVIVQDATDEQMIKAMAHENGEDYSTDFLIQLNTWEGGLRYLSSFHETKNPEALEVARLLGMTYDDPAGKYGDRLGNIAMACKAAHALIGAGHLNRDDLRGLSVRSALQLTQAMVAQMDQVDNLATMAGTKASAKHVEKAKGFVSNAGKVTATRLREGTVSTANIRSEVNYNAFQNAAKTAKSNMPLPILKAFAHSLCASINKMLTVDSSGDKLVEVRKALSMITLDEDREAIRRIQFELDELAKRSTRWSKRIEPDMAAAAKSPDMKLVGGSNAA